MNPIRKRLLERHAPVEPRLDALRQQFLAGLRAPDAAQPRNAAGHPPAGWRRLWQEVFLQARAAWSGLAAAGLVALALNASVPRQPSPASRPAAPLPQAHAAGDRADRARLLAEILEPGDAADPEPPPSAPSQPAARRRSSITREPSSLLPA